MKVILIILLLVFFKKEDQRIEFLHTHSVVMVAAGVDCYTIASGNFNAPAIWYNGIIPGPTNKCTISANTTVTLTQNQHVRIFDFGSQGKFVTGNFTLFVDGGN